MKRFTTIPLSLAAASLAVLTACSSSPAQVTQSDTSPSSSGSSQASSAGSPSTTAGVDGTSSLDPSSPLAKAAKSEGKLTLYTDMVVNAANAQAKAFTDKYGVDVNVVRLAGAALTSRFMSERAAGASSADVVIVADPVFAKDALDKGYTQKLANANIPGYPWAFPQTFLNANSGTAGLLIQVTGIAYNTDLVSPQDVPKTWKDLLNPRWKGKIGIADPGNFVSYDAEWVILEVAFGPDFLKRLGAQKLRFYQGGAPTVAAVGSGEVALAAAQLRAAITPIKDAGGPIAITVPDGPATGIVSSLMLSSRSAHPNAAKLFAAYAMSPEGAAIPAKISDSLSPYDTKQLSSEFKEADYVRGAADQKRITTVLSGR